MSLAPSYFCFGCVNIANNARTRTYIEWACRQDRFQGDAGAMMVFARSLCRCPADDEEFVDPITDVACWYDPSIPESADFLGVVVEKIGGVRASTTKREVTDAINRGSVIGSPTTPGKQMVVEVLIIATSKAGQNYGIQWFERQFNGDQQCGKDGASCTSCQGQLLTMRLHCPLYEAGVPVEPQPIDKGLHSWAAAAAIDGFTPDEDRAPAGLRNCEKLIAGTITLATEQKNSYSTEPFREAVTFDTTGAFKARGNCMLRRSSGVSDPRCPTCLTLCDPCMSDPGCDCRNPTVLIPPEVQTTVSACFTNPLCRCIAAAQLADVPAGYETTLRLRLRAGYDPSNGLFTKYGMRNAVVRIWEVPDVEQLPLPAGSGIVLPTNLEQYDALTARLSPCAELGVSWMPAGSELVIDGISGRSYLLCNGQCYDHSARVHTISGTVFPLTARCTDLYITMEWDCQNVQGSVAGAALPSSVSVEAFLGYNL